MAKAKIIRDAQEKKNYWDFPESSWCAGTETRSLKTGDYTIEGYEDVFAIERKFSTGEFSGNVTQARFERELDRLDLLAHSFLLLEFDFEDMKRFPEGSGIPRKIWPKLKVTSNFLIKRLHEIDLNHNVKIIFAGAGGGDERAELIFRYILQKYRK